MEDQKMLQNYKRAEQLLPWNVISKLRNIEVRPTWLRDGCFLYCRETKTGCEYILVDVDQGTTEPLFDHSEFSKKLASISGEEVDPQNLPIEGFHFNNDGKILSFDCLAHQCSFKFGGKSCCELSIVPLARDCKLMPGVDSHNNRLRLVLDEWNVAIQKTQDGSLIKLTEDGSRYRAYGKSPESNLTTISSYLAGEPRKTIGIWSPDNKKILTHRLNEEDVRQIEIIQNTKSDSNSQAVCHTYRMPVAEDENRGSAELLIFDAESAKQVSVDIDLLPIRGCTPLELGFVWWGKDSNSLFIVRRGRCEKSVRFEKVDLKKNETKLLYEETSDTFIETSAVFWKCSYKSIEQRNEFIVFSEKSGWGHLYLHDMETGKLKRQLTEGEWTVFDILKIDVDGGFVYFIGGGKEAARDPYYRHLYRVNLDSLELTLLTPENADHSIIESPNPLKTSISPYPLPASDQGISIEHGVFVETYSTVESAPRSVLRRVDGSKVLDLETASYEELERQGWVWPERIEVASRDGKDRIYGVLHRPRNFDPGKKYPVIDIVYPGPHAIRTRKDSFVSELSMLGWYLQPQILAELGFIVLTIDGLGTPFRSKAFQDFAYRNIKDCGLPDHISGIRQLAETRPFIDLSRVGVIGHSAGGYAAVRALLEHGDFYKVGISSSGSHNPCRYLAAFYEQYLGEYDEALYSESSNAPLADKFTGKLMLCQGDLDENVHPSHTFELVDALVKANKDFELLVIPDGDHTVVGHGYLIRRQWDFLVRYLLDKKPPHFVIHSPRFG